MIKVEHPEGLLADEPRAETQPIPAVVLARFFTPKLEDPGLIKIRDTFASFAAHLYQVFPSDRPLAEALEDLLKARDNYIKAKIIKP